MGKALSTFATPGFVAMTWVLMGVLLLRAARSVAGAATGATIRGAFRALLNLPKKEDRDHDQDSGRH